ncbi:Uncharacterised protein [Acinetobacter baumannii]|uniref:hypothetical protein n=1 Tax=Providencia sp. PROV261 TaxID=2949949 RepID=UPI000DE707FE|nr:hypothetical protein [Providencia sp. PROV261]SST04095.1 Uncharacterised protein [Acinetobacter baumannii]
MNKYFIEVECGVYVATSELQDYLKDEKLRLNLTWKAFSERIGGISPEFLGSIARGTSSNRFSEETKASLVSYINSSRERNEVIPNLSAIPTEALITEIKQRLTSKNTIKLPHRCPRCGRIASSFEEIDDVFGFRNSQGLFSSQSWCRDCRRIQK